MSVLEAVLEEAKAGDKGHKIFQQKLYSDMLASVIKEDDKYSPIQILDILGDMGKTTADLEKDVERYRIRIELKKSADKIPQLEAELAEANEKALNAREIRIAAVKDAEDAFRAKIIAQNNASSSLASAVNCLEQLERTCIDQNLIDEKRVIDHRYSLAHEALIVADKAFMQARNTHEHASLDHKHSLANREREEVVEEYASKLGSASEALEIYKTDRDEAEKLFRSIDAERNAVIERMIAS